ncbi:nuclear transport factor 2 family protein [Streptomyces sp. NPDC059582]|uniref:nuclear transport factor 2 family protein n=1 Tax=Streptomyces sp. NPDC059582 TaxID=3346875 RepID=UPI0036845B5D
MKYMLLVCGDDTADASGMAPVEPWVEELGDRGVRLHGHRLALPAEAVTVRVRGGEVLRTDGPFAETKEYVAGYDILECASLEEAVEAAAKHPVAALGAMEVRPFWPMEGEEEAEKRIRRLEAELTEAARDRDVDRALACYAPDAAIVLPDSGPEPLDTEAFRKAQQSAYADLSGPVRREVLSFRLRVDESVAFAHALVRIDADRGDGTPQARTLRVTTGYRAVGDRWLIAHEHASAPGDGLS